ncbi:hypothetical protein WICMUC_005404 [Wickerhamomyces mucosus]|uniref:Protein FAF1 n=1 Tax=Wickerhamomyces mucosus TaxID=1378264 RepID=A0A9P8P862_9ASCO|nr:hypothetical protein WICMUC_005404 [Wickerhamomyces mucosus]
MGDADYVKQLEIQRKAFEAQFGSLEDMGFKDKTKEDDKDQRHSSNVSDVGSDNDSESDTSLTASLSELEGEGLDGFDDGSEEEEEEEEKEEKEKKHKPQVIKFQDTTREYRLPTKDDLKLLKSGKSTLIKKEPPKSKKPAVKESEEDLQNDLELQRFLKESHILSNFNNETSGAELTLSTIDSNELIGDSKKHQLKSRLSNVSAVNKVNKSKLQKMPMAMRKGMVKSQLSKIAKFEKNAKEEGIILSKVGKGKFRNIGGSLTLNERIGDGFINEKKLKKMRFREKGLDVSSKVGKSTRNGLIISQRDIDRISGSGGSKGKRKHGRR